MCNIYNNIYKHKLITIMSLKVIMYNIKDRKCSLWDFNNPRPYIDLWQKILYIQYIYYILYMYICTVYIIYITFKHKIYYIYIYLIFGNRREEEAGSFLDKLWKKYIYNQSKIQKLIVFFYIWTFYIAFNDFFFSFFEILGNFLEF